MRAAVVPISVHTFISAPREEVFDLIGDMAARVAFADHLMRDFHLTTARSTGVGAAARFRLDIPLRRATWAETGIVEADRPHRIAEEGHSGRLGKTRTTTVYELTPHAGGVTRVELTFGSEPGDWVERLREGLGARRWMRRQQRKALDRLRRIFEERHEGPLPRATIAGYEPLKAARFGA